MLCAIMFTWLKFIKNTLQTFVEELIRMFKDEGALLFCVLLPLGYPLLYSWIYNNEVVREVPIAVVDDSKSSLSREFTQRMNASPDVSVSLYCTSVEEAKDAVGHGLVYGFLYFPEDFALKTGRMEQSHVSVFSDMSYMLTYKAIYQTSMYVSMDMGTELQTMQGTAYTSRDAELSAQPLQYDEVPIFNATCGYGNFILPAVLVLIIQQSMLLVVGMLAGTDREQGFVTINGVISTLVGKGISYFAVFFVMTAYVTLVVPRLFGFVMMAHFHTWLQLMIPYVLACSFFAMALSSLVRFRENVMLLVVFTSIPMLFMSGISWPQNNIPGYWQAVANLIPSTFGIRGFVRMSSMGAEESDIEPEILALWIQVCVYSIFSLMVIYYRYLNLKGRKNWFRN